MHREKQIRALLSHALTWSPTHLPLNCESSVHCESFCEPFQSATMIDVTRLLPKIVAANPELAVKMAWSRAAGEGLRRNTHAFCFAGKTLTVSVADALWQKQLQSMSAELI